MHPPPAYLVVLQDEGERSRILRQIAQKLGGEYVTELLTEPLTELRGGETSEGVLQEALFATCLFSRKSVLLLEQPEKLRGAAKSALLAWLERPSDTVCLLMGSSSSKCAEELLEAGKRSLVALDLGQEKPWDREKRLKASLLKRAHSEGVQIVPEALELLMERIGPDARLLMQELEKLICYVGPINKIVQADVERLATRCGELSGWQIAEALVWKGEKPLGLVSDSSELIALISQVRYYLQIGACLAESRGESAGSDVGSIRQAQLAEYKRVASRKGAAYFIKALEELFELEILAKSVPVPPAALWDRFVAAR